MPSPLTVNSHVLPDIASHHAIDVRPCMRIEHDIRDRTTTTESSPSADEEKQCDQRQENNEPAAHNRRKANGRA